MTKWLLIALSAVLIASAVVGVSYWRLDERAAANLRERGAVLLTETEAEQFNLDGLTVPRIRLVSTGGGRDGLSSLVDPPVVTARAAEALAGDARVVGVAINGEARAYPVAILNWHECINDTLGGVPIAVVFCPLCDSVSVFDRRPPGHAEPLDFGIAGLLLNSNLVLYDRTDDALWSQVKMEALSGPYAGQRLRHLDGWELATFSSWRTEHPEGTVVSGKFDSEYDFHEPRLTGYLDHDGLKFPVASTDKRLPVKEPVIGLRRGEQAKAWPVAWIRRQPDGRVIEPWAGGTVELAGSEDGGIDVVRVPEGTGVVHTLWFAWAAFYPGTAVAE